MCVFCFARESFSHTKTIHVTRKSPTVIVKLTLDEGQIVRERGLFGAATINFISNRKGTSVNFDGSPPLDDQEPTRRRHPIPS
jgi:hypothetical protein